MLRHDRIVFDQMELTMLSKDELLDGMPFILKLRGAAGAPMQWVETLRGDVARRWFEISRTSNWPALRAEAAVVFRNSVSEEEAEKIRRSRRCLVIHPPGMKADELLAPIEPA
jgi:hypothetical protein